MKLSVILKSVISAILLVCIFTGLVSCKDTVRCSYAELALDLPRSYEPYETDSFDAAFYDGETVVGFLRISFVAGYDNGIPDTLSPEKFARFYMEKIGRQLDVSIRGDVPYYIYYNTDGDVTYFYLATFYRTLYAYFVITYVTEAKNEIKNTEAYLTFAKNAYMLDVETTEKE